MRILATSAGSGVVRAVRIAASLSPYDYDVVTTSSAPEEAARGSILVPPTADRAFDDEILRVVSETRPKIVFAGRDIDAARLALLEPALVDLGASVATRDHLALAAALDKAESARLAQTPNDGESLPAVRYASTASSLSDGLAIFKAAGRAVVKPRLGFASHGVTLANSGDALAKAFAGGNMIVQEYLEGAPVDFRAWDRLVPGGKPAERSYQLVLRPDGSLAGWWASVNVLHGGRPTFVDRLTDQITEVQVEALRRALASQGASGIWNVQGKLRGAQLVVFELNGRCTGITGVRAHAGFNELDILAAALGLRDEPTPADDKPVTYDCRSGYPGVRIDANHRLDAGMS